MFEKLGRVAGLVLDVDERLEPHGAQLLRVVGRLLALVHPVRCNAAFGHGIHRLRANLELHGGAQGADQRGVQALVAIGLGDGDVVLETARHGLVELVQHAQGGVAIDRVGHHDPKAEEVVDLREARMLFTHLSVDGVGGFFAAADAHLQAGVFKGLVHLAFHALHDVTPPPARALHRLVHRGMAPGVQVREAELLQLTVHLVQAQAVGNGRVDVQGFAGDAPALGRRHGGHGAHVVQPVGQLDQDHAHVARHGQQHLAKALGLRLFTGAELQLVELGQAVHQFGRGCAKTLNQLGFGDAAVLHRVVHERRHDGLRVQAPARTQAGHRDGVGDVGLTAGAELAQMGGVGKLEGFPNELEVAFGKVGQHLAEGGVRGHFGLLCFGRTGARRPQAALQGGGQQVSGEGSQTHGLNLSAHEAMWAP